MRIIAGKHKNQWIFTPSGDNTRPLLSRVRKSVMDILNPYLDGARVLDLYTGTGIVSLESISRGAAFALCVDSDERAVEIIKQNHQKICPKSPMRVIQSDVLKYLPFVRFQEEPFDVISITPPYSKGLEDKTLQVLRDCQGLMHEETVIVVQHFLKDDIQLEWDYLEHVRSKKYGKTKVEFFMPLLKEEPLREDSATETE